MEKLSRGGVVSRKYPLFDELMIMTFVMVGLRVLQSLVSKEFEIL